MPVAFTEETLRLGELLPAANVFALAVASVVFITPFVYYDFCCSAMNGHVFEYAKRVVAIYLLPLSVVGGLLTLIQECPWGVDSLLGVRRTVIVALPASMSAATGDMLKRSLSGRQTEPRQRTQNREAERWQAPRFFVCGRRAAGSPH